MSRHDGRRPDELRPVKIDRGFARNSPGSVLYRSGGTTVLVTAQISDKVPPFLEGKGIGWLTAEYAMLPGSTPTRKSRGPDGR
ncbi:ribonuclease PH, partial [Singulisphaera rosea]